MYYISIIYRYGMRNKEQAHLERAACARAREIYTIERTDTDRHTQRDSTHRKPVQRKQSDGEREDQNLVLLCAAQNLLIKSENVSRSSACAVKLSHGVERRVVESSRPKYNLLSVESICLMFAHSNT
jgi:hypothetical protein